MDTAEELLRQLLKEAESIAMQLADGAEAQPLQDAVQRYAALVRRVHATLDARVLHAMGDDLPLKNNSYLERDELELSVAKAKHVLHALKEAA